MISTLDWTKQIHKVCLKANRKLAVLRSIHYIQQKTLDLLYKVLFRSFIDYVLPVYYHSLNVSQKKRLSQIQYRACKLCTGALHLSSQLKLELEMGWIAIEKRADFLSLCLFHKILCGQTRPFVRKCIPPRIIQTEHNTFFLIMTKQFEQLPTSCRTKSDKNLRFLFALTGVSSSQEEQKLDLSS